MFSLCSTTILSACTGPGKREELGIVSLLREARSVCCRIAETGINDAGYKS